MSTRTIDVNGDQQRLAAAMRAHQRGEVIEELSEGSVTLRRVLGQLYGEQSRVQEDPAWRDDLAYELASVLQVLNDAVRQMGDLTIDLDANDL